MLRNYLRVYGDKRLAKRAATCPRAVWAASMADVSTKRLSALAVEECCAAARGGGLLWSLFYFVSSWLQQAVRGAVVNTAHLLLRTEDFLSV